jgi:hypothetical protein
MVVPLASGASAVALGTVMISATLIELFVLRRPPVAAMACLSAHTYVAWSRLPHRAPSAEAIKPPAMKLTPGDSAPLRYHDRALHEGMNVAGICERAGGVEDSGDRRIRVDPRDAGGSALGGIEENVVSH